MFVFCALAAPECGRWRSSKYKRASCGAQGLPLPVRWDRDRAGQPGLVRGRHLHPDGQGLSLFGGDYGLGEPRRSGLAAVEHARPGVLCRGARGSARALRPARDFQYRPEPAPAKAGGSQFTNDDFTGTLERHAIAISMDGKGRCRVCILSSIAQSSRTLLGRFFGTACLSR